MDHFLKRLSEKLNNTQISSMGKFLFSLDICCMEVVSELESLGNYRKLVFLNFCLSILETRVSVLETLELFHWL